MESSHWVKKLSYSYGANSSTTIFIIQFVVFGMQVMIRGRKLSVGVRNSNIHDEEIMIPWETFFGTLL